MTPFTPEEQLNHPYNSLYLIEASAGTGKTYTIANLYLRHILEGKAVKQILVVTFTNAATDELRGRIRAKLYDVLQLIEKEEAPEDDITKALLKKHNKSEAKARLELAVRSMDEAAIFTIHGFCQLALKEFAFLSGQSFNLELNTDEDELLLPIAKDWWRRNIYDADPLSYQVATSAWKGGVTDFYRQIKSFLAREISIIPKSNNTADLLPLLANIRTEYKASRDTLWTLLIESKALLRGKTNSYYHKENLVNVFDAMDHWVNASENIIPPDEFEALTLQYLSRKKGKNKHLLPEHDFFNTANIYWEKYQQQRQQALTSLIESAINFISEQGDSSKKEKQTLSFNDLLIEFSKALSSTSGKQLCHALQSRYPIGMIDEFQDTDPIQYSIFKQLYVGQSGQTLYMIGDPKQAIYSFRGGDIYTYLQAKQDVEEHGGTIYTLDTNWRSTPKMLHAVNTLFSKSDNPFIYEDIKFQAVKAPETKTDHKVLSINGETVTPLNFWLSSDNGKPPLSKDVARREIDTAVAAKISKLIQQGKKGVALLGGSPLQAKDIAVLVPSHSDAKRLRQKLAMLGVNSVTAGKQTVFESHEAEALSLLLQTVLMPDDRDLLRQSLACHLLALNYKEIHQHCNDDQLWMQWVDNFRHLHEQWQQEGFMSMFLSLLEHLHIAEALAKQDDTDRIMTNLLQLGELLQQASTEQTGIDALITWFEQKRTNASGESAELRLESDEELVKLVTLHASKGLEYGVVFLPYLWNLHFIKESERPIIYHDEKQNLIADTGSNALQKHYILAERERLAEDARLVYVALTRAVACCYIAWGNIGRYNGICANHSALAYLLHGKQTTEELKENKVASLNKVTADEMMSELNVLAKKSDATISVTSLKKKETHAIAANDAIQTPLTPQEALQTKTFNRNLSNHWRITSFSALSRNIHHTSAYSEQSNDDPILNFPAGKRTGLYLHSLFELLNFQDDISAQVNTLNQHLMPRYGLDVDKYNTIVQQWATEIINTPLDKNGLSLAKITQQQLLTELEFHFSTGKDNTKIHQLNHQLSQQNKQKLQALNSSDFHGLVHGIIDLVFDFKGKYYLIDYKSNYLGNTRQAYDKTGMQTEISKRRYDLQYTLYSIALHRFLENRVADYDYEKHFGGVYYLFFRGMRENKQTGVFFTRSNYEDLDKIQQLFQ